MEQHLSDQVPVLDSEAVRRNAAWFAAGVSAATSYSFIACLVFGPVIGYGAAFLGADAGEVVSTITAGMLVLHGIIGQYLKFKSRTVGKNETVIIDPF